MSKGTRWHRFGRTVIRKQKHSGGICVDQWWHMRGELFMTMAGKHIASVDVAAHETCTRAGARVHCADRASAIPATHTRKAHVFCVSERGAHVAPVWMGEESMWHTHGLAIDPCATPSIHKQARGAPSCTLYVHARTGRSCKSLHAFAHA